MDGAAEARRAPVTHASRVGPDRRRVLRALGLGATGIGLGGLGALTACSSDDGTGPRADGPSTTRRNGTTTTTRVVPPYDPDRPYWVQGNFAPVTTEETITNLRVRGTLPRGLSGLYVRNGSNAAHGEPLHWFLGDGMIHGVRIERGRASWYRNRYVRTPLLASGKDLLEMGAPPGKANNQSNVALVHHAGKLLTLGEVGWPYEVRTDTLDTVGPWDFDGKLGDTMTAHPKVDPDTGRLHFFGYDILQPRLTYYEADRDGQIDVVTPLGVDRATMVHDFAITDREAVFWIGPVVFGADATNPDPRIPFHWDPTGPSRVGVLPFGGGPDAIRWVDIPPCFVFHGMNAHRDGDDIVLHVHRLDQAFGPEGDLTQPALTTWRIGTAGPALTFEARQLSDRPMDLPTHDRRHTGRPTRWGWCATVTDPGAEYGFELAGIARVDLTTGASEAWEPGQDRRAGEGLFVPDPDGRDEGDGWVLAYVWDRTTDRSSLGVFDAHAVRRGPVAWVDLPVRVPFGFHGVWVDAADL